MIPPAEVSRLSHRFGISDKIIEKDYILTWLLIGLSKTELQKVIVFKGGTALRKIYFDDYRYSEDLDFTLNRESSLGDLVKGFEKIYSEVRKLANISIQLERKEEQQNTLTLYLNYVGPLGGRMERNVVKIDITLEELLLLPVRSKPLLKTYSDQPHNIRLEVYSLGEIGLEKVCSLLDSARKEPRDVYDLWYLINSDSLDLNFLKEEFHKKCQFKELEANNLKDQIYKKEPVYERLWETRLAKQMTELPHFNFVYRRIKRHLRQAKFI